MAEPTGVWVHVVRDGARVRITHGPGWPPDAVNGDFWLSQDGALTLALELLDHSLELDSEYVTARLLARLRERA